MVKFATDMSEFRFKQFSVSHDRSSMKVGVDGVLIGCWCPLDRKEIILDLGTGCGLIALICAQRSVASTIIAIDIHAPSVEEASANFLKSPWGDKSTLFQCRSHKRPQSEDSGPPSDWNDP